MEEKTLKPHSENVEIRTNPDHAQEDTLVKKYDEVKNLMQETLFCNKKRQIWVPISEHECVKKKYKEEFSERKRLCNEVMEPKGNIRVFCRCRPLNQGEISSGCSSVVDFESSNESELHIVCNDSSKKHFKFDHVFRPEDDQEAVFSQTSPVVASVLDGYNVCIFAYGQTGTGKTFTMEGTPDNRGVNYRILEELFRISKEQNSTMEYKLFVSMLEVYNEKIRDLLVENSNQPGKRLEIKQSAEGTQEVPGLVEAHVQNTDEVWEQLNVGSQNRSVGSTNANELSSRSHSLLRVTVKGENMVTEQKTRSHLWLVDLAGSERVGRIEVEGERLKESQFINKSLAALGDVISALASKTPHIPYRNSKLTHLLQSSLGGDCKTLMFVQISPSSADLGETLCSLNFASRVRGIEHGPVRKQADLDELFKNKQMAEKLRHYEKETNKLQNSLQSLQLRFAAREQLCRSLQEKVRDLETQLAEERKARLQEESRVSASSARFSSMSFSQQNQHGLKEKKPPQGSLKLRAPLRGITNLPLPPVIEGKSGTSQQISLGSGQDKENVCRTTRRKTLMMPRRVPIAVRPSSASMQSQQPRRRDSIATFYPESHSSLSKMTPVNTTARSMLRQPQRRVSIATVFPESQSSFSKMTPGNSWSARRILPQPKRRVSIATSTRSDSNLGSSTSGLSFLRQPRRISTMFSPLPPHLRSSTTVAEETPVTRKSSFIGSPPLQIGSWKPKNPTVIALHKRHFVWSPLKQRCLKNERNSLVPSRLSEMWK